MDRVAVDTVIVGAGVAGIGCATRLDAVGHDFVVVSQDVGGRILCSDDGVVNYGAFFVCSDYEHVLPWVRVGKRIRLSDFCFHDEELVYQLYEPRLLWYLRDMVVIRRVLRRFRQDFRLFRKRAEWCSQKQVFEEFSWLYELFMMDAMDFVSSYGLERGTKRYLEKGLYSTTFSSVDRMNAFSFLEFLLPLITPIYRFVFQKQKVLDLLGDRFVMDTVTSVDNNDKGFVVRTKNQVFEAQHVVLATEIGWSGAIAGVHMMNKPVRTCMMHVRGRPRSVIVHKEYQLFCEPSNVQAIADNLDGTYLFYYKRKPVELEQFFVDPEVLFETVWDPAGRIDGHSLIEADRGNGLYLAGDFNIAGLEEAYITGMCAANKIIHSL